MKTKIRLQTSWLLNELLNLPTTNLQDDFIDFKKEWDKHENKILNGLKKITGLNFAINYIDVFVVHSKAVKNSISHPLIIKLRKNKNASVRTLVHELTHNLMWDNIQNDNWSLKIQKLFPNENKKTAIHVGVHAILEAVYNDILKNPGGVVKDIEFCQSLPDYKRAWEIVKEEGYKNIIKKLKS